MLGHSPKLPDIVKPFRKSKTAKNDHNDAQAILVAGAAARTCASRG
jgi:hypothetical protein